jgi:hypothetical protein
VLLHEFDEDLILALELGFELFDLALLGILDGLGLAAVVEGQVSILEEQALPLMNLGRKSNPGFQSMEAPVATIPRTARQRKVQARQQKQRERQQRRRAKRRRPRRPRPLPRGILRVAGDLVKAFRCRGEGL